MSVSPAVLRRPATADLPADLSGLADLSSVERPRSAPLLSQPYWRYLTVVGAVYLLVFGGMLVWTDGLPYVLDNNESFSTVWHAQNMATQDFRRSFWLTDESYGQNPESHPFVHSHQGNFPRLFGYVLYVLGARSVEAQIVLTTMTIGVLAVFFLFHFFSQTAGPRFGCIAALVFMTDYLFFAQWHVVTYRVWHPFLLFASLLCVRGVLFSPHWRRWLALTLLTYLGLFYYELVYVAFVSLLSAFYAVLVGWRRPVRLLSFGTAQAVGGGLALGILLLQLAAYLGWRDLRDDLYLTYVARNFAADSADIGNVSPSSIHDFQAMTGRLSAISPEMKAQLQRFYDRHNLVFWWNLVDSRPLRTPTFFAGSTFVWVFQAYTPLFTLLTATVLAGWAASGWWAWCYRRQDAFSRGWQAPGRWAFASESAGPRAGHRVRLALRHPVAEAASSRPPGLSDERWRTLSSALCVLLLMMAAFYFVATVIRDRAFLGLPLSSASFAATRGLMTTVGMLVTVVVSTLAGVRLLTGTWSGSGTRRRQILTAVLLLIGLTAFIRTQPSLYDQEYAPLWYGHMSGQIPLTVSRLSALAAAGFMVALVIRGPARMRGSGRDATLRGAAPYLVAGVLAYGVVYYLAAGYVLTGYLIRFGTMPVFVVDVAIAVAVAALVAAALHGLGPCASWLRRRRPPDVTAPTPTAPGVLHGALAALLLLSLAGVWTHTQLAWVSLFPADQFTFLKMFAYPPYRGASFAVSNYAAPVAHYTQQWAYFDPMMSNGQIGLTPEGRVQMVRDMETYLWLADKRTNPTYARPDFYACIASPSLRGALDLLNKKEPRSGRCSNVQFPLTAKNGPHQFLKTELVATDPRSADVWSVVKIDWEPLPYLAPLPDGPANQRVRATVRPGPRGTEIGVEYRYQQSEGRPERASSLRLYEVRPDGAQTLLSEVRGPQVLDVPAGFQGMVRVSVLPRSDIRAGLEVFSEPIQIAK